MATLGSIGVPDGIPDICWRLLGATEYLGESLEMRTKVTELNTDTR